MAKSICCLFSIENNYDQPSNNLVAWWSGTPSFHELSEAIKKDGTVGEEDLLVNVLSGEHTCVTSGEVKHGGTSYRLEWVEEGCNV